MSTLAADKLRVATRKALAYLLLQFHGLPDPVACFPESVARKNSRLHYCIQFFAFFVPEYLETWHSC